jgi:hypothetical protein
MGFPQRMKYTSFATLAAVFAVAMLGTSPANVAAAKSESKHTEIVASAGHSTPSMNQAAHGQIYASNDLAIDSGAIRFDARPASLQNATAATSKRDGKNAPLDTTTLVFAGAAVVASLALRRAPKK